MIKGAFKSFIHKHSFENLDGKTLMHDLFQYEVPFGILGLAFDKLILKRYMRGLLITRNETIKDFAESEKWKTVLS
jgi:ligand-binding SRPBCC domain-containing protein